MRKDLAFPPGFLWGSATSAYQVEGGNTRCDWFHFEGEPGRIERGERCGASARHYDLFEQDFRMAGEMGQNAHRFSLEWSRIEPEKAHWDPEAVAHYREVFRSLRRNRLAPMVTLHHFTNPLWVAEQGGWENEKTVGDFADFVTFAVEQFRDEASLWITINEPLVYAYKGYVGGEFPPGRKGDMRGAGVVIRNLLRAHGRAYRIIHRLQQAAQVGIASAIVLFDPFSPWNPLDRLLASYHTRIFDLAFLDAAASGLIRLHLLGTAPPFLIRFAERVPELRASMDFIGVNYYTRYLCKALAPLETFTRPGSPQTDLGWEIYPAGMLRALQLVSRYRLPIYITENGIADARDDRRPGFIVAHLQQVLRAIGEGIDVRGYFHWSLLDNFEWAQGFRARFGLMQVDYESPEKTRSLTDSARLYGEIARTNALPLPFS